MAAAAPAACVPVDATDPLYILYTSGTTGKPKGVVRDNGGHAVALAWSMRNIYDIDQGEVFWAASDIGWVVGHSYIVYAPLLAGCTTILYEGKPVGTPTRARSGGSSPSTTSRRCSPRRRASARSARRTRRAGSSRDATSAGLRYLFLAGERLDPETYRWAGDLLDVPVIDHWWQTETGWAIVADPMGLDPKPTKPGSPSIPVPGYDVQILDKQGNRLKPGERGTSWSGCRCRPARCRPCGMTTRASSGPTWSRYPGYYLTGDGGFRDEDGYLFVMGRIDDVINVAGHRLSTGEMEEVLASHQAVAECAVFGVNDELKGEVPRGLVVLKAGVAAESDQLGRELAQMIRDRIGPIATLEQARHRTRGSPRPARGRSCARRCAASPTVRTSRCRPPSMTCRCSTTCAPCCTATAADPWGEFTVLSGPRPVHDWSWPKSGSRR